MLNLRKYGQQPYEVAVIHGGPGASGEMAPVASHLSQDQSVLEPLQTQSSFVEQLEELKAVLENNAQLPLVLIGYSYGSLLSFVFTSLYPTFVQKLILVSSSVFEDHYASEIMHTRLQRMGEEERAQVEHLFQQINDPQVVNKDAVFSQLGELISQADSYDSLSFPNDLLNPSYELYTKVQKEVHALRASGKLLDYGKNIHCPVVAIHGDYDPHPYDGIQIPLARTLKDFQFILLEKCGHHPWLERHAKNKFYEVLEREITSHPDANSNT